MPYRSDMYPSIEFPDYEFQEYPKWVEVDGNKVIVNSKEHHDELIGVTRPAPVKDNKLTDAKPSFAPAASK